MLELQYNQNVPYIIFNALKYKFISLEYGFEGTVLTLSCKALWVDLT